MEEKVMQKEVGGPMRCGGRDKARHEWSTLMDAKQMTDEYAAGVIDTRGKIHLNRGYNAAITLHLPQEEIAEALIEYFGGGMLSLYTPPHDTRKRFHVVTFSGYKVPEVLSRVLPYLVSDIAPRCGACCGADERACGLGHQTAGNRRRVSQS
jgi:hypothetical protein